uniref:SEL1L family member 3 n=1 Tax=Callorhinchus milii TaxID=7868 RepID=A0A4W3IVL0_CALMI
FGLAGRMASDSLTTTFEAPLYGANTSQTTSVLQRGAENYKDSIQFINATNKAVAHYTLSIEYMCSEPSTVGVEVVVSSDVKIGVPVYKRRWKCEKYLHTLRNRILQIKFPSIMLYRADYFTKQSIVVNSVILRGWIAPTNIGANNTSDAVTYEQAVTRTYKLLEALNPFERPYKNHKQSLRWDTEKIQEIKEKRIPQCLRESDVVQLLRGPFASTGRNFGVVKKLSKFDNMELEIIRKHSVRLIYSDMSDRFTISMWIYVLRGCKQDLCGIIHYINANRTYGTPLLFLTQDGNIHFQMKLSSGKHNAGKSKFKLPFRHWCRLDLSFTCSRITGDIGFHLRNLILGHFYYNDTSGYFVLAGSSHVRSFEGFFGPVKYYRIRALDSKMISNPLELNADFYQQIEQYYEKCQDINKIIRQYFQALGLTEKMSRMSNQMFNLFTVCSILEIFIIFLGLTSSLYPVIKVGEILFHKALDTLTRPGGLQQISHLIPSFVEASCCGYYRAAYFLGILFEAGLGVDIQPLQSLLYSMVAAQGKDRLALMHLGYKHYQGIDGYFLDYDMSFGYYISVAKMTVQDRQALEGEQALVEPVRLMDNLVLEIQTKENHDLFLWLRYQANHGNLFAQKKLAQMLYWGQQGVMRDIKAAAEWYSKSALETGDPLSMYEYALILFKGRGVEKNTKLALKLLKKAASKGSHEAINGLGWYYETFEKDYVRAVSYWEEAMKMGNLDALHNLGVVYGAGLYPGMPEKNEIEAFHYYYEAGFYGHIESAIHCSSYWSTGSLQSIPYNPRQAVLWAKYVAEQNGFLGYAMRKAINAYIQKSWNEALLYFLMTAETGIESSQTNIAYFCEENPELTSSHIAVDCAWKYYNLSAFQENPYPYALVKMGDYYYYGHKQQTKDMTQSVKMYSRAALQNYSQAYFNLGTLVEEGIQLPPEILELLDFDIENQSNTNSDTIKPAWDTWGKMTVWALSNK